MKFLIINLLTLSSVYGSNFSNGASWVSAHNAPCDTVCRAEDKSAIYFGQDPENRGPGYVCKLNVGSGEISGWQIPARSNVCASHYHEPVGTITFSCLCE